MMKAFRAYKFALEHFDEETLKQLFAQVREEIRNAHITADDDALDPEVTRILQEHGCTIEHHGDFHRVMFPKRTTCNQYLVTSVSYCLLTLPSGLQVKQIGKPNRRYSFVFIVEENHAGYPNITY